MKAAAMGALGWGSLLVIPIVTATLSIAKIVHNPTMVNDFRAENVLSEDIRWAVGTRAMVLGSFVAIAAATGPIEMMATKNR
jgi:hypothetical protein